MQSSRPRSSPGARALVLMLAVGLAGIPPAASAESDAVRILDEARALAERNARYEEAAALVEPLLQRDDLTVDVRRRVFLQLASHHWDAYEQLKTDEERVRVSDQQRAEELALQGRSHYQSARETLIRCLQTPDLRHVELDPPENFHKGMVKEFPLLRAQYQGSFRVTALDPAEARVTFNGAVLETAPGDTLLGDDQLVPGVYEVQVSAKGFRSETHQVEIPGGVQTRMDFDLRKNSGPWPVLGLVGGVVAGVVGILASGGGGGDEEPDLPGPPDPPGR